MSKIAKYKLIDKNTKIILPISICFPLNPTIKKKSKKLKACQFRKLELLRVDKCFILQNYDQYMKNIGSLDSMEEKQSNSKKEYEQQNEDQMIQQENDDDSKQQEVIDFLQKSKTNFFKNLIYAFQNHILYQCDEQQKQQYRSHTQDDWTFDRIKLRVQQNLQNCGRFGLKVRNIFQNENLSGVFLYFLKNSNQFWLDHSKIKDKESYKKQIEMILNAFEKKILIQNICYYKKFKKLASS
ncbi:hypothetical protein TTHERM_00090250 (macronuclear) [Tetrahymena thermophila SB210]|uniref:Uncharacterized protein n=1 Tax=Tetrahymena thermophila (strain SB210) TaxID=312017 RepID=Q236G9_TETTS|nr:hypothetical protein TTHERM_00090250 [Tetrahymena thermophila SB210]EAR92531.2 hypothetical protein TTHERM_00090250 [Tetrahymena thermophila SB210]|eukprot:XP_001012776.2 hypothetical protein TTHERM_00090250 [Tetrahymena thermophila SB210]